MLAFMSRVLFVDDEPNVLQGLRRMLRGRAGEWQMAFAAGGEQALALLEEQPFDVVVSDMRMPGIDGPQLLAQVRRQWPATVRMVLSGHSDQEATMRLSHEAHQYLRKPCDADVLVQTIGRSLRLRSLLADPRLVATVSEVDSLPALPDTYSRITEALRDPERSLREIGTFVESDVGLSAKLLQLVNSAFFGAPRQVATPADAAVLLGVEVLAAVVLGTKLFDTDAGDAGLDAHLRRLWQQSVSSAALARRIAIDLGNGPRSGDQAFVAGLLHDIGDLVLLGHEPRCYLDFRRVAPDWSQGGLDEETKRFGAHHGEIGAYLLGLWSFADDVVEAVAFHHSPSQAPAPPALPLVALNIAIGLTEPGAQPDSGLVQDFALMNRLEEWRPTVGSIA